jgi:hypothetical protein
MSKSSQLDADRPHRTLSLRPLITHGMGTNASFEYSCAPREVNLVRAPGVPGMSVARCPVSPANCGENGRPPQPALLLNGLKGESDHTVVSMIARRHAQLEVYSTRKVWRMPI